jgi:hypothetical protein
MDSLANRLTALLKEFPRREKRLEFEEYQQRVLALRESAEAKLQTWTDKLGQQEEVEQLMEDYQDFVTTQQLFNAYSKLSTELGKKAETWRKSAGMFFNLAKLLARLLQEDICEIEAGGCTGCLVL